MRSGWREVAEEHTNGARNVVSHYVRRRAERLVRNTAAAVPARVVLEVASSEHHDPDPHAARRYWPIPIEQAMEAAE
jgi:hypothetical protein